MVAQTNHLLIFNESSGTAVTQYGTAASGYAIQQGTSPTNYEWHADAGSYDGYLDSKTKSGGSTPYMTTAATAPSATLETINCCVAVEVDGYDTAVTPDSSYLAATNSGIALWIRVEQPSGSGNFDITLKYQDSGSGGAAHTIKTACTFGTLYIISTSIDVSTPSSCTLRWKVNSDADGSTTESHSGYNWGTSWPRLNVAPGFTNYGGLDGRYHFFAYQRGGTAWSAADLANINSNPSSELTGWPGGASVAPLAAAYYRRIRTS